MWGSRCWALGRFIIASEGAQQGHGLCQATAALAVPLWGMRSCCCCCLLCNIMIPAVQATRPLTKRAVHLALLILLHRHTTKSKGATRQPGSEPAEARGEAHWRCPKAAAPASSAACALRPYLVVQPRKVVQHLAVLHVIREALDLGVEVRLCNVRLVLHHIQQADAANRVRLRGVHTAPARGSRLMRQAWLIRPLPFPAAKRMGDAPQRRQRGCIIAHVRRVVDDVVPVLPREASRGPRDLAQVPTTFNPSSTAIHYSISAARAATAAVVGARGGRELGVLATARVLTVHLAAARKAPGTTTTTTWPSTLCSLISSSGACVVQGCELAPSAARHGRPPAPC
jgi:hypothetical protein